MARSLQLATWMLLTAAAAGAWAQISDPNSMVSGPPRRPAARHRDRAAETGSVQWLWQYARPTPNGNAVALRDDERFITLLTANFKQPQAMWGKDVPVATIVPRFLARYGAVNVKGNRYLTVDGCIPSFCAAHGLLWMDLGTPQPLMVFAAVNWSTEGHTTDEPNADYNLWLFSNRQVSADALPLALTQAVSDWDARLAAAHRGVPHITHAVLVEPSGQPYPLNPTLVGANTLPPQPDTITPKQPEEN